MCYRKLINTFLTNQSAERTLNGNLGADSGGGFTQGEDGVVLRSVQPVDRQFGAGGPLHHGDVILLPEK